eukprot:1139618-Pelagomonas_calceolata.AAC.1
MELRWTPVHVNAAALDTSARKWSCIGHQSTQMQLHWTPPHANGAAIYATVTASFTDDAQLNVLPFGAGPSPRHVWAPQDNLLSCRWMETCKQTRQQAHHHCSRCIPTQCVSSSNALTAGPGRQG